MVAGPTKRLKHASNSSCKLLIAALPHALQQGHLLFFEPAVHNKMVEIHGAHGQTLGSLRRCATTKQAGSDNAHAKHVDETVHDWLHMLAPILKDDEALRPGSATS